MQYGAGMCVGYDKLNDNGILGLNLDSVVANYHCMRQRLGATSKLNSYYLLGLIVLVKPSINRYNFQLFYRI